MIVTRAVAALLVLLLVNACGLNPIDCELHAVARLPLSVKKRLLVVPAGIDGNWVRLLVDTGAERTVLSEDATRRLNLTRDSNPRHVSGGAGVGGSYESRDAIIPALVLDGKKFIQGRIPVTELPWAQEWGVDGLLGADVLLGYDIDIDVPGGALTLYRARRCPDVNPPWDEPSARIPGVRASKDRLLLPLEVDGAQGMGILDTGAQSTTLGNRMAVRLGLTAQDMAGDIIVRHYGAGPGSQESRLHQFQVLKIGPAQATRPLLSVLSDDVPAIGDALVGEDFINGRRIWMSFTSREVFVATTRPNTAAK